MLRRHWAEKSFLGLPSCAHLKLVLEWQEKPCFLSGLKDQMECYVETSSIEE